MSKGDYTFKNSESGEFITRRERKDGTSELMFGPMGMNQHEKAVIGPGGNVRFMRSLDGMIIADDSK